MIPSQILKMLWIFPITIVKLKNRIRNCDFFGLFDHASQFSSLLKLMSWMILRNYPNSYLCSLGYDMLLSWFTAVKWNWRWLCCRVKWLIDSVISCLLKYPLDDGLFSINIWMRRGTYRLINRKVSLSKELLQTALYFTLN